MEIDKIANELTNNELNIYDYIVNPYEDIKPPKPILAINQNGRIVNVMTEDNISLIQGKSKSRKSLFLRTVSCAILGSRQKIEDRTGLQDDFMLSRYDRNELAIFDTEQGKYHCWRAAKDITTKSKDFNYYSLSSVDIIERKKIIEMHLERNPDCGIIIIDNIVDLLQDYNSSEESNMLVAWLIKTKATYNCHIVTVLHENSGSTKAKGHLGSLLETKAESVIRIEKDESISVIEAKMTRNGDFQSFAIWQDFNGNYGLEKYTEPITTKI